MGTNEWPLHSCAHCVRMPRIIRHNLKTEKLSSAQAVKTREAASLDCRDFSKHGPDSLAGRKNCPTFRSVSD